MTVKTTKNQLEGIVLLLSILIEENKPASILEKLILSLVMNLFQKLRKKTEAVIYPKSGYSVKMTDLEAMALHTFYKSIWVDSDAYTYEAIKLERIIKEIDQQYGGIINIDPGNRRLASGTS